MNYEFLVWGGGLGVIKIKLDNDVVLCYNINNCVYTLFFDN